LFSKLLQRSRVIILVILSGAVTPLRMATLKKRKIREVFRFESGRCGINAGFDCW
jgi:hypothetical protein